MVDPFEYRAAKLAEVEFRQMDSDRDGMVTRDEWRANYGTDKDFDHYDKDGDGLFSIDEFRLAKASEFDFNRHMQCMVQQLTELSVCACRVDTNKDGKVSRVSQP